MPSSAPSVFKMTNIEYMTIRSRPEPVSPLAGTRPFRHSPAGRRSSRTDRCHDASSTCRRCRPPSKRARPPRRHHGCSQPSPEGQPESVARRSSALSGARVGASEATLGLGLSRILQQDLPECRGSRDITIRDGAPNATFARECRGFRNTRPRTNPGKRRSNPRNRRSNPAIRRTNPVGSQRTHGRSTY